LLAFAALVGVHTPEHRVETQQRQAGQVCPWDFLQPATIHFCEFRQCSWIQEPANTWSNLIYFLIGIVIVRDSYKDADALQLRPLGWSNIALGFGSFLFHASGTFIFEVADVGGMFLLSNFWLLWNINLLKQLPVDLNQKLYVGGVMLCGIGLVFLKEGIVTFIIEIVTTQVIQLMLVIAAPKERKRSAVSFTLMVLFFALAFVIWQLDLNGHPTICDPHNHFFQGHAAWHLLNGVAIWFLYKHFKQWPEVKVLHKGRSNN